MRSSIFGAVSLLFSGFLSFSQGPNGWIHQGAEFYHSYNLNHENGYLHYYLAEEFLVNGRMLQRLNGEKKYKYQTDSNTWVEHPDLISLGTRLFHTSNDTVYYANEQGELRFAWHLNPQVGDVWDFGLQQIQSADTAIHAYGLVTEVATVEIGGVPTLDITFQTCIDDLGTLPPYYEELQAPYLQAFHAGKINTLLGPRNNFHFQFFYEIAPIPAPIVCFFQSSYIACYQSDVHELTHFGASQSCLNGVSNLEKRELPEIKLHPNPTKTSFSISCVEPIKSIKISDIQGKFQEFKNDSTLNISHLNPGIYLVYVETNNGNQYSQKLVVEE